MPLSDQMKALRATRVDYGAKLTSAWELIEQRADDTFLRGQAGWIVFDEVKRLATAYQKEQVGSEAAHRELDRFLADFRQFGAKGKDYAASNLLSQMLKFRDYKRTLRVCRWWHDRFEFGPDDLKPYQPPDGREIEALAQRFRTRVARLAVLQAEDDTAKWAWAMTEEWARSYPPNGWFSYHYGKGLIERGRIEEASLFLPDVTAKNMEKGWAWGSIASLLEGEPEFRFVILHYAVALEENPCHWGENAVELASILAARGRTAEAAWVVARMIEAYRNKGWRVQGELAKMNACAWARQKGVPLGIEESQEKAELILAALCSAEQIEGSLVAHDRERRRAKFVGSGQPFNISYKVRGVHNLPVPSRVRVGQMREGRVIFCHPCSEI